MDVSRIAGTSKHYIGEPTEFRGLDGKYAISGISGNRNIIEIGNDWVPGLQIEEDNSGFLIKKGGKSYVDQGDMIGSNHDISEGNYKKIDLAEELPENIWFKS